MDFDLESLVHLEQTFYDSGYKDGFDHGRIHGLIEGRALGREKGFEMWEELGFYEGFARIWEAILTSRMTGQNEKALNHIKHLLAFIAQFPKVNPSVDTDSGVDVQKLFRQIRSRYKALCSVLGVRPSLRASDSSPPPETGEEKASKSVWPVDKGPEDQEMTF